MGFSSRLQLGVILQLCHIGAKAGLTNSQNMPFRYESARSGIPEPRTPLLSSPGRQLHKLAMQSFTVAEARLAMLQQ